MEGLRKCFGQYNSLNYSVLHRLKTSCEMHNWFHFKIVFSTYKSAYSLIIDPFGECGDKCFRAALLRTVEDLSFFFQPFTLLTFYISSSTVLY